MTLFKFPVPVKDGGPDMVVGQYELDLDNSILGVTAAALGPVKFPIVKHWMGKEWRVLGATPSPNTLTFDLDIRQNPIPFAVILGGLGVIGAGVVAVVLVKELRRLVSLQDVTKSPWAVLIIIGVLVLVGIGLWRK